MAKGIEKLVLRNFRGATQPVTIEFDPNKPVVVLFGENGCGKSTLVDAIDFVCNEDFGSLADRSGSKAPNHIMSQGAAANDLEVVLTANGMDWAGKLAKRKPQRTGPAGQTPPEVMILRRPDITRLMDMPPGEKYDMVKGFITLPRLERVEASLRDAAKAVKAEFDLAVQLYEQARETLEGLWQAEGHPQGDARAWANVMGRQDVNALQARIEQANERLQLYFAAAGAQERLEASEAQVQLRQQGLATAQQALATAERGQAGGRQLAALLEEAQAYLKANAALEACPVCGEPKAATDLLKRVSGELEVLKALTAARTAQQQAAQAVTQVENEATGLRRVYMDQARQLATALSAGPRLAGVSDAHLQAVLAASDAPAVVLAARPLLEAVAPAMAEVTRQRDEDQKALNLRTSVIKLANTVADKQTIVQEGEALAQRLDDMLAIVDRERKAHVEKVLRVIAATVDDLYNRIHPKENLGQLKMTLNPQLRASLELSGAFGGQTDVPPAAYYSDSHLDTLGLCVYLALARHKGVDAFIVLDDVLTSVDDAHQERIVQLLHDESAHFGQVILTTHLRSWRDRYRRGEVGTNDVHLLELHSGWTSDRGLQTSKTKLSTDELRGYLAQAPMSRDVVASKAGVLLEGLLDWLALRYELRLPRRADPRYTLGDLLGALDSKLRKALRVERMDAAGAVQTTLSLQKQLDDLSAMTWIRNQVGAHHNPDGDAVPDSEVRRWAETTLALADALACPTCGSLPCKLKDGSYCACPGKCGLTHLHPLKQPG